MAEPASSPTMRPLRRLAIRFVNPVTRLFAGWLPGFALLTYHGRTTGRVYRIPINVLRRGDTFLFALTYGGGSQWAKNVLAARSCEMQRMGRHWRLVEPELIVDPSARLVPIPLRWFLTGPARVTEFLRMNGALVTAA